MAAFVLLARVRVNPGFARVMQWASDKCFLVFFMHVLVLERVANAAVAMAPGLPTFAAIPIHAVVTFLICLAFASALRLVPGFRLVSG